MPPKPDLTAPIPTDRMPSSVPFIIGNEAAERFCYYGMQAILVIFMTRHLRTATGELAVMTPEQAKYWFHLFVSAVYFLPLFGAVLADAYWGKYRTIFSLSLVYCVGCFALALDSSRLGLVVGLALIAIGSGGIKPCVSANVGDQFGPANQHLLTRVFGWFYFSVNLGSAVSTYLTPVWLHAYGPRVAFGIPGLFMLAAAVIFWRGRRQYVQVQPAGAAFFRETFSPEGLKIVARLALLYVGVMVFWALWNQTASAWVLQAERMNLRWLGLTWLPEQVQVVNPILILVFIPLFSYGLYPALERVVRLTPLRKIGLGLFLTVGSFLIPAWIEMRIAAGFTPSVGWQVLAYVLITAAEILVSVTCLEFSYTQAPQRSKSLVMALYYLAISLGNVIAAVVNKCIQNPDGSSKLTPVEYYLFFAAIMLGASVFYVVVASRYREESHLQAAAKEGS